MAYISSITLPDSSEYDLKDSEAVKTAGTGLSLSGTTINHAASVTAGTAGTSSATTGTNTLAVPYVTYNTTGHITASGTHTHTISEATTSSSGLMSASDKTKLSEIGGAYNASTETISITLGSASVITVSQNSTTGALSIS